MGKISKAENKNALQKKHLIFLNVFFILISGIHFNLKSQNIKTLDSGMYSFKVPEQYLQEREDIPSFWQN